MLGRRPLDYYIRSVVTGILSLGIVGAAIYAVLVQSNPSAILIGWAGVVIGVYFGAHVAFNSRQSTRKDIEDVVHDVETHRSQ